MTARGTTCSGSCPPSSRPTASCSGSSRRWRCSTCRSHTSPTTSSGSRRSPWTSCWGRRASTSTTAASGCWSWGTGACWSRGCGSWASPWSTWTTRAARSRSSFREGQGATAQQRGGAGWTANSTSAGWGTPSQSPPARGRGFCSFPCEGESFVVSFRGQRGI